MSTGRVIFEGWAMREGYPIHREGDGETYCDPRTQAAWWTWKYVSAGSQADTERAARGTADSIPFGPDVPTAPYWTLEREQAGIVPGPIRDTDPRCPKCRKPRRESGLCWLCGRLSKQESLRRDGEEWERVARDVLANARPIEDIRRDIAAIRERIEFPDER